MWVKVQQEELLAKKKQIKCLQPFAASMFSLSDPTLSSQIIHNYALTHTETQKDTTTRKKPSYALLVWANSAEVLVLIFPEGGAVQGVGVGLQSASMVAFKVLPPDSPNGHLVEITELEEELDRYGTAAHHCWVVINTPVLPLGVWANNTLNEPRRADSRINVVSDVRGNWLSCLT